MKIIDAHTHIRNAGDGAPYLYDLLKVNGVDMVNVLSLQAWGEINQNAATALVKLLHPDITYTFGGLDYVTGRDFREQAELLYTLGYDGIKMIEGKPTTRKKLNIPLDDASYDPYYSFLEENQFPVLMHIADPPTFWDISEIPAWAKEMGWFYDDSFIPFKQYYCEMENVLSKHPKLPLILAHFYFLSHDIQQAQKILDDHPCVRFDITAGIEMYENFSADPATWREFFIKNSDRILYGTDSTDDPPEKGNDEISISAHGKMEIDFLRTDSDILHFGMIIRGLGLPDEVQSKILNTNFTDLVGDIPKVMDVPALIKEAEYLKDFMDKDKAKVQDNIINQLKIIKQEIK